MTLSCSWPLSVQHSPTSSAADLWQHRVNNNDWSNGWSWTDDRLGLLHAPDETFLRFLAEMVHPSVRPDQEQREAYLEVFNKHLVTEGWEIGIVGHVGAHPGQVGRRQRRIPAAVSCGINELAETLGDFVSKAVVQQL